MSRRRVLSIMLSLILIFTTFTLSAQAENSNSSTIRSRLGVNLDGLTDYSTSIMFVDAMKSSRAWGNVDRPWESPPPVDANGWPTTDAGVIINASIGNYDISGVYKLSFQGAQSTNVIANTGNFTLSNKVYKDGIYTMDLNFPLTTPKQSNFFISFKNTVGGVKDVKLIRPGYPAINPPTFTNEFLKAIEPFSTLRFMDYLCTNDQNSFPVSPNYYTKQIEWSNRKLPTDSSQAASIGRKRGGAWEYIVELANLTGKDIWVNVPANSSQDYMAQLAKLLNDNVRQDVHIYVEYSNEVWNWQFPQAQLNGNYLAKNDPVANTYVLQYAKAVGEMSKAFKSVFGATAMNDRLRIVCAWQFGYNPPDAQPRDILNFIKQHYGEPSSVIYALAFAPYFYESKPENSTSIAIVQNNMIQNSDASVANKKLLLNLAKSYNLVGGVTCYEGGPHHQGQVNTNLAIRMAAHTDPAMKDIIIRDMKTNWFDFGGGLFMYFTLSGTPSIYGSWGMVETFNNLNTPKYNAIMEMYNSESPGPTSIPTKTPSPTPITTQNPLATPTRTPTPSPTPSATPNPAVTQTPGIETTASPTPTIVPVPVTGVLLSKASSVIKMPNTLQLNAVVIPINATDKAVIWSSSNTKVATVSTTGKVTSIGVGSAIITVKSADGSYTKTCRVTVIVGVKSIKLNKTAVTIKVGKSMKLVPTFNPSKATNKKVTWKSSNSKIVTVTAKGSIKGIKKGTAYITVLTVDGKKSSKCKVVVK